MRDLPTTLLFLRRGDSILLAMKKTGHGQGHWNGVGGKVDAGETIEQALIRECQEEIQVTPLLFQKMAEMEFYQLYKGESLRNICHTYVCTKWDGAPTETDEMAPQWCALSDIPYGQMWADDRYWLPLLLQGTKLHGVFHYSDENTLLSHELTEITGFA